MLPWKIQPILEEVIPWTKISCANWMNVSDRSTQGIGISISIQTAGAQTTVDD